MNVDPVGFLPPQSGVTLPQPLAPSMDGALAPSSGDAVSRFGAWFNEQLAEVNGQLQRADAGLQSLALGDAQNLHQVMINLEEAKLSLQLLVQVRNHALDAYQEILRMSI
jgi:flagellar hook-basal body complex protein FliE